MNKKENVWWRRIGGSLKIWDRRKELKDKKEEDWLQNNMEGREEKIYGEGLWKKSRKEQEEENGKYRVEGGGAAKTREWQSREEDKDLRRIWKRM